MTVPVVRMQVSAIQTTKMRYQIVTMSAGMSINQNRTLKGYTA